jgi:lysophospholipase L1-like esterase
MTRDTTVRRIPVRRKVLYTAVLCLIFLGACEAALRARAWMRYGSAATTLRDPMLTYVPAADLFLPTPGYEIQGSRINIKINSLGFRGDEFSRDKPANTFRIVCIGASTTFSSEASDNHKTWPHRLQEKLQAAYPAMKFEVINAAVAGYVAADNLKNLKYRVLPLNPDLVIYYEAHNEIVRDTKEIAIRDGLIGKQGAQSALVSRLSNYSLMFDLAYKNLAILSRGEGASAAKMDRVPPELPQRFIGVLDEMRAELERRDIQFVLSTFLVKYRRDQDRQTQIANADIAFYYMPWMSIDGLLNSIDVYNQAILDYAKRSNLPVVDDREAIPPDAEHYADCVHMLDKGGELMADRFAKYLRASGVVDRLVARRLRSGPAGG